MAVGFAVTVAIAVFFLDMGIYALAAPAALIRPFGVTPDTPTARSEIRAVYGGFGLAIPAVLGYAAFREGDVQKGSVVPGGLDAPRDAAINVLQKNCEKASAIC